MLKKCASNYSVDKDLVIIYGVKLLGYVWSLIEANIFQHF